MRDASGFLACIYHKGFLMPTLATDANGIIPEAFPVSTAVAPTVAAAGTVIANATALSTGFTVVSGADDTKGVVLPTAAPGKVCEVYTSVATSGLKVYPPVNGTINDGSANSAVVIEGKSLARFVGTSGTNWAAAYTANS